MNNKKDFFKRINQNDDFVFQTGFNGGSIQETYNYLKEFLKNEGFGDLPLPNSPRRLWWDYLKPDEGGHPRSFKWHPITISVHPYYPITGLQLNIYNEYYPDHMPLWEETMGTDMEGESKLYHYKNQVGSARGLYNDLFNSFDYLYNTDVFYLSEVNKIVEIYNKKSDSLEIEKGIQSIISRLIKNEHFTMDEKSSFIHHAEKFVNCYNEISSSIPFDVIHWEKLFLFLKLLLKGIDKDLMLKE